MGVEMLHQNERDASGARQVAHQVGERFQPAGGSADPHHHKIFVAGFFLGGRAQFLGGEPKLFSGDSVVSESSITSTCRALARRNLSISSAALSWTCGV